MRILAIDPSGTGTTGICLVNSKSVDFKEYKDSSWKNHYNFITSLIKSHKPNLLLFENSNYISNRSKDSLNLIRLMGAIETLPIKEVQSINVLKVKELSKALFAGRAILPNLVYLPGRGKGWLWKGNRISIHQLEAYLVAYIYGQRN
jgi:hypothetical protein